MKEEAISVEAGIIEETVIAKQQWAIPEKIQTQGWGYAFSRSGIKKIACGISRG